MELKANDLRIGNLLYYDNEVKETCSIHSDNTIRFKDKEKGSIGCFSVKTPLIKPIPLTEEWLLKFGFKHSGNGFFIHIESLLELSNIGNEFFLAGIKGVSLNKIYHIHQLQNLYFALTNKELQIKM